MIGGSRSSGWCIADNELADVGERADPGGGFARFRKMTEKAALRSLRFRASVGRVRGMWGVERVRRALFGALQPEYTALSRGAWSARGVQDARDAGRKALATRGGVAPETGVCWPRNDHPSALQGPSRRVW